MLRRAFPRGAGGGGAGGDAAAGALRAQAAARRRRQQLLRRCKLTRSPDAACHSGAGAERSCVLRQEIPPLLAKMDEAERKAFILMQRIFPPPQAGLLTRGGTMLQVGHSNGFREIDGTV